jgi:hypothetical protein
MRPDLRHATITLAMVAAVAGCGGTEPSLDSGLTVTSGAGITDTVEAELPNPLVVQLVDSAGAPIAGQQIQFESRDCADLCPVYLAPLGGSEYVTAVRDTTDAQGTAAVRVKLGFPAGEGLVRVTAIESGVVTTATYIVAPGQPAFVGAGPVDTTLYVGGHYLLRPETRDRFGNPREGDDVTFALVEGPVTLDAGGMVTATDIGRGLVELRTGSLTGTAAVSVVPHGQLVVTWQAFSDTTEVRTINLDGSGLQTIANSGNSDGGFPAWARTGPIVFVRAGGLTGFGRLLVTTASSPHRLLAETLEQERNPRVSRDGTWIYFQSGATLAFGGSEIWRVQLDGNSPERVGAPGDLDFADIQPDPSPDGSQIVYVSSRPDGVRRIVVRDLDTGVDHPLGLEGSLPRWSPAGEWIAYLRDVDSGDGTIWLVRPGGSDNHQLSLPGAGYQLSALDWSPDAAWLIAHADPVGFDAAGPLTLVDAASGKALPLGWSYLFYRWPAWKPD